MDMSLIAGMPEVIAYIRSQDERIKDLKKDLEAAEHTIQHSNSTWQKSYEKLEEECRVQKQMKENVFEVLEEVGEKNKDLNRILNDVNYVPFNSNYTEKAILEFIGSCPVNIVEKINQKENEALKEENKSLKEIICVNAEDPNAMDWIKDFKYTFKADREFRNDCIDTLEKENEKLKEQIDDIKDFLKVCDRNSDGYYEHYETRQIATRVEGGEYKKD